MLATCLLEDVADKTEEQLATELGTADAVADFIRKEMAERDNNRSNNPA